MKGASVAIAVVLATLALPSVGHAADDLGKKWGLAEAKEHGCLACHDVDTKKVGPAYKDVSAKFKGKSAADMATAMKALPVHQGVLKKTPDSELKLLTQWILSL